jgi:hypothetical protein
VLAFTGVLLLFLPVERRFCACAAAGSKIRQTRIKRKARFKLNPPDVYVITSKLFFASFAKTLCVLCVEKEFNRKERKDKRRKVTQRNIPAVFICNQLSKFA